MDDPRGAGRERAPNSRGTWVALALLLGGIGALSVATFGSVAYHADLDEGTYQRYVAHVAEHGLGAFPELFRGYAADSERWIFPSPLRVGFVAGAAGWAQLFGASYLALSWFSLASHLAFVLLNFVCVRRHRGDRAALGVSALLGFSALHLVIARTALMDSHAVLWQAATFWLFVELLHAPARRLWSVLFVPVCAWTIVVKEASVLVVGPLALLYAVECLRSRGALSWQRGVALFGLAFTLAFGVLALAAGGIAELRECVQIVRVSLATNEWAKANLAGPWYRYVVDALLVSPYVTLVALLGAGAVLLRARDAAHERWLELRWFAIAALGIGGLSLIGKDLRYAMALHVATCLAAWCGLEFAFERARPAFARAGLAVAVLLLCVSELCTFSLFIDRGLYDPVTHWLVRVRELVLPQRNR